jgi:hypothetical protein
LPTLGIFTPSLCPQASSAISACPPFAGGYAETALAVYCDWSAIAARDQLQPAHFGQPKSGLMANNRITTMKTHTPTERLVISHVVRKTFVVSDEYANRPFEAFEQIAQHVNSDGPEPTAVYIEDCISWAEALDAMEREVLLDLAFIRQVLHMVKEGICLAAIDAQLDSDINALDMQAMLESGLLQQELEA